MCSSNSIPAPCCMPQAHILNLKCTPNPYPLPGRLDLAAARDLPCPGDTMRLVRYGSCPERIMIDVSGAAYNVVQSLLTGEQALLMTYRVRKTALCADLVSFVQGGAWWVQDASQALGHNSTHASHTLTHPHTAND